MAHQTRRDYFESRRSEMTKERQSFISHYKLLSDNIQPRRGRFHPTDRNRGVRRHNNIINSVGTQALGTASAGMLAGIMSPARPWFDLVSPDTELMKFRLVKVWYKQVAEGMRRIFNASNLYTMAPSMIEETLLFGTGCISHMDDEDDIARFYTHTAGSYLISQDDKFKVNTLVREFMMTAEQMATEFGKKNLSMTVQTALDQHSLSQWYPVVHFIEPNDEFRPASALSKFKKFSSVKYEPGQSDKHKFLSEKGFDDFPAYCPRWSLTGEDVYGTNCPGMVTLGDVKGLQILEKRKAQGVDKQVNPALTGPASLRNVPVSQLAGGLTLYDGDPSRNKLESIHNVNIDLSAITTDIERQERRINDAFFVNLFLAITNSEGIQPKNQMELSEINAERLLQLGPVLERKQGEFLDPMINRTFKQMVRRGLVPEAPEEIQGQPLKIEYISSLAQAQRSVDTRSIDRLTFYVAGLKNAEMSDGRKFNADKAIEKYADLVGTPPDLITDDREVADARADEAAQQEQAAGLEAAEQAARAARDAGQVDLGGDNPVARAVNNA